MDLAHDAIIIRDTHSVIESWNAGAHAIYGWTASEATGKVSHDLFQTKFPVSLDEINRTLADVGFWEGELLHRCKSGRVITVLSRWSLLRTNSGFPLLIKEINQDITQERRRSSYLRLLSDIGDAMGHAQSDSDALRWALTATCLHTNWRVGRAFSFTPGSSILQPAVVAWHVDNDPRFAAVRQALEHRWQQTGDAPIAARSLASNEAVWISDLRADPYFAQIPEIAASGLTCAFAQPVSVPDGETAVLVLFSDAPVEVDDSFINTMSSVAQHLRRYFVRRTDVGARSRLAVSLMRAQDDERRRIARELHDSAGQYLGALGITLEAARISTPPDCDKALAKLDEADSIIKRCSDEIRTLSHLLHPPLLGLSSAVNWYVEGFMDRSGIQVTSQVPRLSRLDTAIELALFRVLQECLNNIHRHSGSKTASVTIAVATGRVTLEIADQGKGIPQEILRGWFSNTRRSGVGISGMRERLADLGGSFEITSSESGTVVRATIPVRATDTNSDAPATGSNGSHTFTPELFPSLAPLNPSAAVSHAVARAQRNAPRSSPQKGKATPPPPLT